jgi:hypothetical protein
LEHLPYTPDISLTVFLVSTTNNVLKGWFASTEQNDRKNEKSTDRGIKKWFRGLLLKALQTLPKVCHCSRELRWRKHCVHRCKVIHQFSLKVCLLFIYMETTADKGCTIMPLDRTSFQLQNTIIHLHQWWISACMLCS